jgi:hypothetical protein
VGDEEMKLKLNGQDVDAKQIGFSAFSEPWGEYHLEDGRIARLKVVMTKIFALDATNDDGSPMYNVQSQVILAVDENDGGSGFKPN